MRVGSNNRVMKVPTVSLARAFLPHGTQQEWGHRRTRSGDPERHASAFVALDYPNESGNDGACRELGACIGVGAIAARDRIFP